MLDPLAFTMNIAPSTAPPISPFYLILYLYGFVISNFYLSLMSSFLASTLEDSPIVSLEDVIRSKMPISSTFEVANYLNRTSEFRSLSGQVIIFQNRDDLIRLRDSFNSSFIYLVPSDTWTFLNIKQQYLQIPVFRLSNFFFTQSYGCFLMKNSSILGEKLHRFYLMSLSNGIYSYWKQESFRVAVQNRLVNITRQLGRTETPLGMKYFYGIFVVLSVGWVTGSLVVIIEIYVKYLKE